MDINNLEDVYDLAVKHAKAEKGPREDYLMTFDKDFTDEAVLEVVIGDDRVEVEFHIDNSPAIYYNVGDIDDLVYISTEDVNHRKGSKSDRIGKQAFVNRVKNIAEDYLERF